MKRFLKILFPILILVVCWYFVAKEEDYQVSFTSEQSKSLIFQQILDWENYSGETESVIVTNDRQPYSEISQSFKIGDSSFLYQWELNSEKNNSTKVTAHITDLNHSFKQRLQVPFFKNDFVKRSVKNVEEVGKAIAIKGKQFKLGTIERTDYGGSYCAYLPVTSSTKQKASNMLATIAIIMEYLKGNDIELQGDPFLEVTSWDEGNDMIQFNFCFPISKGDSLPLHASMLGSKPYLRNCLILPKHKPKPSLINIC